MVDGNRVFVSSTTRFNCATMTISEDLTEQAEHCLIDIAHALKEVGVSFPDVGACPLHPALC
jgi:enamine deaminase RidA (YjgF/YER057c/UK114 family)